ncbi:MAG: transcriptional repressor [Fibrobacteres bacterium]|nr:transcriptional repressor [Fibrobacterota bacterium]
MEILNSYLKKKGLKQGKQRLDVVTVFLETEKHITPEELHDIVKKKHPNIGIATVYRTLKLLSDCGLAREVVFDGRIARYEHNYGHDHHDHLVCVKCGVIKEVIDPEIENLQIMLAKKHGFKITNHRMEIYGTCKKCGS